MMDTAIPTLSRPEDLRATQLRSAGHRVRARSASRSPDYAPEPLVEELPVRVLVVFEFGYRSYGDAIAGAVRSLRPHAEVTVAEPLSLRAEVTRFSPHLVISSQPNALDPALTTAWVRLPHESDFAGEICFGDRCVEVHDVDLGDLLAVFDEVENLIYA
jgi:hypothetical protein